MMLKPYPGIEKRWYKVRKHVFLPGEGWGVLLGDLPRWLADWNTLRVAGCWRDADGYLVAQTNDRAREVLDRNHGYWLAEAQRAWDEARATGAVPAHGRVGRNERFCHVSSRGVKVVVGGGFALVTCFRPRGARRSAVRRDQRHTSLLASARAAKRSDNDQR